jgi:hypothetical protein
VARAIRCRRNTRSRIPRPVSRGCLVRLAERLVGQDSAGKDRSRSRAGWSALSLRAGRNGAVLRAAEGRPLNSRRGDAMSPRRGGQFILREGNKDGAEILFRSMRLTLGRHGLREDFVERVAKVQGAGE